MNGLATGREIIALDRVDSGQPEARENPTRNLTLANVVSYLNYSGVLIPSLSVYRLLIFRIKVGTTSRSLLYDLNSKSRGGPTKIFYS